MGKLIRLTVTITITDTWTFVGMTEDDPQRQAPLKTKEEPDESLQATLMTAKPAKPRASDSMSPPLTTTASLDPQSDGVSIVPNTRGKGRRTRRQEAGRNQPSD